MIKFGFVFLLFLGGSALLGLTIGGGGEPATEGSGPAQNQRLTALNGLLLYVLLIAIAATVLDLPTLLPEHYLVGFVLIPPLVLKFGSTGYRFLRYYAGNALYRQMGAPPVTLRFIVAPVLVVSTVIVFASGLELWVFGLRFGSVWILAHTLSAVVMMLATSAHLAAHMGRSARILGDDLAARTSTGLSRQSLIVASLAAGAVLAIASLLYASPFSASVGG